MEIRAFLREWGFSFGVVCIVGIAFPLTVFDYEISAHAALTAAIIDSYNTHFSDARIDDAFRFPLIRGSMEEDNGSRSLYHFYDPVRNRGLTLPLSSWMSSKEWAIHEEAQRASAPHPFVSTAFGQEPVVFTWDLGIEAYARGDQHAAFLIVGHILHLLEDVGMPDHTRNDIHPFSSPYENFTKTLMPIVDHKKPIVLSDLDAYFNGLAAYSNNNFYSAETIGARQYPNAAPAYMESEGGYIYGFMNDEGGAPYHVAQYGVIRAKAWVAQEPSLNDGGNNKILSDYWRLLSAKTVRYGAGLLHLFLREAEQARRAYEDEEKNREQATGKSFTAGIADAFNLGTLSGGSHDDEEDDEEDEDTSDGLREAATISLDDTAFRPAVSRAAPQAQNKPGRSSLPGHRLSKTTQNKKIASTVKETARTCAYETSAAPLHAPIIINEVAWMGTRASSNDEWIELKNVSASAVAVSGWQLASERTRIQSAFPADALIPAGGFYLLERTDDQAVPFVTADHIYTGSISNSNDGLRLFTEECVLVDEAVAVPSWPAGISSERRTMERGRDISWHDYSGGGMNGVFGTPRAENSEPWAVKPGSSTIVSAGAGTVNPVRSVGGGASSAPPAAFPAPSVNPPSISAGAVVINEFLFDAQGSDTDKEFIELYNTTNQSIDMSAWSLQTQSAKKNFEDGNYIKAQACFLIWLGDVSSGMKVDMQWKSGSLHNDTGSIYVVQNQDAVDGDHDSDIIDHVAYTQDALSGFAPGKSVERKDSGGFQVRTSPGPGECFRQAGAALIHETIVTPSQGVNVDDPRVSSPSAGFLKQVYFYTHPIEGDALVDLHWDQYPFMPGRTDAWKALVLYLNSEPSPEEFLNLDTSWAPTSTAALSVQYPIYAYNVFPLRRSVIFPDTRAQMGSGGLSGGPGGLDLTAYNFDSLFEDSLARIKLSLTPQTGDYITIGYYDFFSSGGGNQTVRLVAADPTRYYFEKPTPVFKPPVFSADSIGSFDAHNTLMTVRLPPATDPDSPDGILTPDLTINGVAADPKWLWPDRYSFFVIPGDTITAQYRVRDDFNISSAPRIITWKYPGSVQWFTTQDRADGLSRIFGQKNSDCSSCPDTANFQSVSFGNETEANVFVVRLQSDYGAMNASVRLTVYPDFAGVPDFTAPLNAQTVTTHENISLKTLNDIAFVFKEPVIFLPHKTYWLALDVASYFDPVSFYRPYLSNAIFSGDDVYTGGVSAKGANGMCGSFCSFTAGYPSASSDWYFKIGWLEL